MGLDRWNADGHRYPAIEKAVAKFRDGLNTQLGPNATPAQTALAASAVALHAGVLLVDNRLLAARGRANRIADLLELLPTLCSALERTLRALGANGGASPDDAPPPGASLEQRQAWSKRYVASVLAEGTER
jgi:hypothetical protein